MLPPRLTPPTPVWPNTAARGSQAVRLCLVVDISPQGTALDEGRALDRIDRDGAHLADRSTTVPPSYIRGAGDVVTPAANSDLEITVAGEAHRCRHIGGAAAAGNQARSAVDGAVPYGSGVVVAVVVGDDHIAPEPRNLRRGSC